MKFELAQSIAVLDRTPQVLESLLKGLGDGWTHQNEGENTWSPFDILGHLIHGEKTDWIVRMEIILSEDPERPFEPFDRFAQFESSQGKTLEDLLEDFGRLRASNLETLKSKNLTSEDLDRTGHHPELGEVTLRQLLATWVVHDLGHIAQVTRVMTKQYKGEVGPWEAYLPILNA